MKLQWICLNYFESTTSITHGWRESKLERKLPNNLHITKNVLECVFIVKSIFFIVPGNCDTIIDFFEVSKQGAPLVKKEPHLFLHAGPFLKWIEWPTLMTNSEIFSTCSQHSQIDLVHQPYLGMWGVLPSWLWWEQELLHVLNYAPLVSWIATPQILHFGPSFLFLSIFSWLFLLLYHGGDAPQTWQLQNKVRLIISSLFFWIFFFLPKQLNKKHCCVFTNLLQIWWYAFVGFLHQKFVARDLRTNKAWTWRHWSRFKGLDVFAFFRFFFIGVGDGGPVDDVHGFKIKATISWAIGVSWATAISWTVALVLGNKWEEKGVGVFEWMGTWREQRRE